jgi:hypothetical protein
MYRIKKGIKNAFGCLMSHDYSSEETIFVAGTGRSGTTWVGEVLASQIGYTLIDEPFNVGPNLNWRPAEFGFEKVNYWANGHSKSLEEYVMSVARGKELQVPWHKFKYLIRSDGYVVKAVLINPCFADILSITGAEGVFVVRHPCGVVSSQIRHPGWSHFSKESRDLPQSVVERYPHFREVFESVSSQEELLAFWWAVENIIPLDEPKPYPWHMVAYESLVSRPIIEFKKIIEKIKNVEVKNKKLKKDVGKVSKSTKEYSKPQARNPKVVWKNRLEDNQIDRIVEVVTRCGFDQWELFR